MTTPLGRVRGLGTAKSGTSEHVAKQFSGFILAILTPYVTVVLIMLIGRPYGEVVASLQSLWIAPPLTAFIVVSIYHMRIGMKAVIEDYVHSDLLKTIALAANWTFCWVLNLLCVFAIVRIFTL